MKVETKIITLPQIFSSGNRFIQEESEKKNEELEAALADGFRITQCCSGAWNNAYYVTYVMEKEILPKEELFDESGRPKKEFCVANVVTRKL